jgi:hypothetical protein
MGFNAAVELHGQEEFDDCVEALRELLAEYAISRYHRIRYLTMLAYTLEDWHEGYSCNIKVEAIWRVTKQWHCDETDPATNKALDLREGLQEVE